MTGDEGTGEKKVKGEECGVGWSGERMGWTRGRFIPSLLGLSYACYEVTINKYRFVAY